jgi:hypothetical protein
MNKLYLGKINLSKIDKEKIFEGKTGKWIDVTIWINEEPDKYGNSMSIEQSVDKGDDKIYLGNAKEWSKKTEEKAPESKLGRTTAPDDDLPY